MEKDEFLRALDTLDDRIDTLGMRLSEHIAEERERDTLILAAVQKIENTLSEAKGAKRLLVWLLGVLFAAIALAKGWIWPVKP